MRDRSLFGALIALSLVVPLTSCSNPSGLDSRHSTLNLDLPTVLLCNFRRPALA